MRKDIILSGVGGQGILTIATIIGEAATVAGLNLKQAEVHGMSQRGGDVQSNLRLSDETIHSDLISLGEADLIISMEPMEALRYLPYLEKEGWVVTAMTGGQDSAGTNKFEAICLGLGVEPEHVRVVVPLPKNMEEITRIIREEIEYKGVSVIIPRRECVQTLNRKLRQKRVEKA